MITVYFPRAVVREWRVGDRVYYVSMIALENIPAVPFPTTKRRAAILRHVKYVNRFIMEFWRARNSHVSDDNSTGRADTCKRCEQLFAAHASDDWRRAMEGKRHG